MYKVISRILVRGKTSELLKKCSVMQTQRDIITTEDRPGKPSKVTNLKKYLFDKYMNYIKNYERILAQKFPRTIQMYRVFSVGSKDLYKDLKMMVTVIKKQGYNGMDRMTREELQILYTMPKDTRKLLPLFLLSAIPFTNYIIFPLALYFPRHLLTSHYWTLQQRLEFMLIDQKKKLKHNKPLFRCMQAEVKSIEDQTLRIKWQDVIACLGSGTHPSTKNIISCRELFSGPPYSLNALKKKHLKELLAIHGMSTWKPFKKRKLMLRGILILQMDRAIVREGGVTAMPNEAMRWALFFRGVNPANMSSESMRSWLEQWLLISTSIDETNISLLLHSPILLAYNHSTNWTLIYN